MKQPTKKEKEKHLKELREQAKWETEHEFSMLAMADPKTILRELFIYISYRIAGLEEIAEREKGQPPNFWARLSDLRKVQRYLVQLDLKYKFIEQ